MRFFLFFIFLFLGLVRFSLFPAPKDKLSFRWRHVQPATHFYFYWDLIAIKRPLFCERIVSDAGDLIITKFYCLNVRAQKTCSCTLTPELPVLLLYIELHWYTSLINGTAEEGKLRWLLVHLIHILMRSYNLEDSGPTWISTCMLIIFSIPLCKLLLIEL